MDLEKFI